MLPDYQCCSRNSSLFNVFSEGNGITCQLKPSLWLYNHFINCGSLTNYSKYMYSETIGVFNNVGYWIEGVYIDYNDPSRDIAFDVSDL